MWADDYTDAHPQARPTQRCGEHRKIGDNPLAKFTEAASHLKLIGDAFRCIETREQLEALQCLIAYQIREARRALELAEFVLEVL